MTHCVYCERILSINLINISITSGIYYLIVYSLVRTFRFYSLANCTRQYYQLYFPCYTSGPQNLFIL